MSRKNRRLVGGDDGKDDGKDDDEDYEDGNGSIHLKKTVKMF